MMQPWGQRHSQLLQGANQAWMKKKGKENEREKKEREKGVSVAHLETCGKKS